MSVPLLDLKAQYLSIKNEIDKAVKNVLNSGKFILGPEVSELEEEILRFSNTKYAISCASGTDALLLSLMAFDLKPGDEVITTPFTFFATVGSISRLGAVPVFVDIDPATFNINPDLLEEKISGRTRGFIPVHLFGQTAEMNPIVNIGKDKNLFVIEDACQSIGAAYFDKKAGGAGDTGCFSFFPSKNLGCFGDGGMVTTNREDLAAKIKMLRVHGGKDRYYHDFVGINSRLDTLQAAILLVELKYLKEWTNLRIKNAELYNNAFKDIDGVTLPVIGPNKYHVFNQYTIRVKKRNGLIRELEKHKIGFGIYYPLPLHLQKCYRYLNYKKGDFPESEKAAAEVISLPVYPFLSDDMRNEVIAAVKDYFGA